MKAIHLESYSKLSKVEADWKAGSYNTTKPVQGGGSIGKQPKMPSCEEIQLHTKGNTSDLNMGDQKSCYVCNDLLGCCKVSLESSTESTVTPLFKILELFTGTKLLKDTRSEIYVCLKCSISFERFDSLQHQSNLIQDRMTILFHQTHYEQVYIKEEPEEDQEDEAFQCMSIDESDHDEFVQNLANLKKPRTAPKPLQDCIADKRIFSLNHSQKDQSVFNDRFSSSNHVNSNKLKW